MVSELSRQQLEIYLLLKENIHRETNISEFTERDELNIKGYTERITELRKKGYQVVNTRKNHYQLQGEPPVTLNDVRYIWREAKKRGYRDLMKRCEDKAQLMHFQKEVWEELT